MRQHLDNALFYPFLARRLGLAALLCLCAPAAPSAAQTKTNTIPQVNREEVFSDDTKGAERLEERRRKAATQIEQDQRGDIDVKAPAVEYLREQNKVKASGGVLLSRGGVQVGTEEALVDMQTKDADLSGTFNITGVEGEIGGDSGRINFDTEIGTFNDATVVLEEGAYHLSAKKVDKIEEFKYKLFDSHLTTCGCDKEEPTWNIRADRANVTQEGYAHTYGATLRMYGVPFFYTPYLAFPVKSERASGLLVPQFGVSGEDGFQFSQPIFAVIDETSDMTFTPFIETQTRAGLKLDLRKAFSREHNFSSRWIYSNESMRDNDLRGTVIDGLDDPQIDTDRFGGFVKDFWKSKTGEAMPMSFVSDIHYVSDDLFLRELDDDDIGEAESRYTTSRMQLRASLNDYIAAEVGGEYNQALVSADETTLQRLPSFGVLAQKSFRPFGFNPYGLKVVSQNKIIGTDFVRDDGYDGWRENFNPAISIPFHYENYFTSAVQVSTHQTLYQMRDETNPGSGATRDFDESRSAYIFSYGMQTAVERVFDLEEGNTLSWLTSLGARDQDTKLTRVKHQIEPFFNYTYVPDSAQDDLPLYDSLDRIRQRSLFTYGFRTSLLGRFIPTSGVPEGQIPELTPRVGDLPLFGADQTLPDYGIQGVFEGTGGNFAIRQGAIREVAALTVKQTYDYFEDVHSDSDDPDENDPDRRPYSDVYGDLTLFPTSYVGIRFETNYDAENHDPSSWAIAGGFRDDRSDSLTFRYSYIDKDNPDGTDSADKVNQIEGNAELAITDRVRLGYYARYDDQEHEFSAQRVALRFSDECRCWFLDVGLSEKINPDKQVALVSLTLVGLGDFTQKFGVTGSESDQ